VRKYTSTLINLLNIFYDLCHLLLEHRETLFVIQLMVMRYKYRAPVTCEPRTL